MSTEPESKKPEVVVDVEAIRMEAVKVERERSMSIRSLVKEHDLGDEVADELITSGSTIDMARTLVATKILDAARAQKIANAANAAVANDAALKDSQKQRGIGTSDQIGRVVVMSPAVSQREAMADAIVCRANPAIKARDESRQYMGMSLCELARETLESEGVSTRGMDRMQIASRSMLSTSDFPNILADVANKSLRQAWTLSPRTFEPWARRASASDFKQINRVVLSDAPQLQLVPPGGEFARSSMTDGREAYQLTTVGRVVAITRQAIINDDLDAFTRIPQLFAQAGAAYESDTVYAILTANANLSDGVALFATARGNLATTPAAISVASLGVARAAMRRQLSPQGVALNLRPRFLIVPAALETTAAQFVSQQFTASASSFVNPFAGALEVIVEPRLDAVSTTAWYLAADSSTIDTVEYAYLDGTDGVFIESRLGFDVDGVEIKARLDFGAKAIDFRGLFRNAGA